MSCFPVLSRETLDIWWSELHDLQTDQTLLHCLLLRRCCRDIGRKKDLSRWSWWRTGGAGANSLVVGLVVKLVVELVVELVDWLVVGLVVQLVIELVVELFVGLVGDLISRLVDEAVGSSKAAVLYVDGELCGVQRLQNAIHVKAESEGVCGQRNISGEVQGVLMVISMQV